MTQKPMKRHILDKEQQAAIDVLEEEYRSFVRVAEALRLHGLNNIIINTPLGDFVYRDDKE